MIKEGKKAQTVFGLSFSAIFSIIIIIAILGVAFYAIKYFLDLNTCTTQGFFYDDLQDEVNVAWTSDGYEDDFEGKMPTSGLRKTRIEMVCFGNFSQTSSHDRQQSDLEYYHDDTESNVFLYPPEEACDGLSSYKLKHVKIDTFFCIEPDEGIVKVRLKREGPLVKLRRLV